MADRLAITVIPGAGWRAGDVRTVAQAAEDAGFDAIFNTEVNSDTMATAQLMGCATSASRSAPGSRTSTCATPTSAPRAPA